jgi:putative nucleotidyltransferase with HDIG domain
MIMTALIAVLASAVNGTGLELGVYVLFGGIAGIVTVRRGERLAVFLQAGVAVFVVNVLVVITFALLGNQDALGLVQLLATSAASGGGAAIATVGSFAVIGSVFGILTSFQLLELANPSQPLLRRLLVETPGTYHHSLMVGNLAERAAEAIGADPLVTRVAAYYHDVGKLANPLAFIENQAGGDNIHDQLDPAVSAGILKQHVADGIDLAYKSGSPSADRVIPQHHGPQCPTSTPGRRAGRAVRGADLTAGRQPTPSTPGSATGQAADPRRDHHAGRLDRGLGALLTSRDEGDPGDGRGSSRSGSPTTSSTSVT